MLDPQFILLSINLRGIVLCIICMMRELIGISIKFLSYFNDGSIQSPSWHHPFLVQCLSCSFYLFHLMLHELKYIYIYIDTNKQSHHFNVTTKKSQKIKYHIESVGKYIQFSIYPTIKDVTNLPYCLPFERCAEQMLQWKAEGNSG